jgi:DNA-directed RNA polymerase subunit RPC12/RpoP
MPKQNRDPDAALRKLGDHIRLAWKKSHPTPDKTLESVRDVIREKWEREQRTKRSKLKTKEVYTCPICWEQFGKGDVMHIGSDSACPHCHRKLPENFLESPTQKVKSPKAKVKPNSVRRSRLTRRPRAPKKQSSSH